MEEVKSGGSGGDIGSWRDGGGCGILMMVVVVW